MAALYNQPKWEPFIEHLPVPFENMCTINSYTFIYIFEGIQGIEMIKILYLNKNQENVMW